VSPGQRLDHQGVAGPGQGAERDGQRLLGAAGDDQVLGPGGQAAGADPARQDLPVARLALAEAIVQHALQVRFAGHLGQGALQDRAQLHADRLVAAEIHRAVGAPVHRAQGDLQALGQVAHGRQARPGRQALGADVLGERRGDRPVERRGPRAIRTIPGRKIGEPNCFHNNVSLDRGRMGDFSMRGCKTQEVLR
jgi:hypothetical protein